MVISVNYDEPNVDSYKSVVVDSELFDSGNFTVDWYDAIKYSVHTVVDGYPIIYSSSVDHFIMDGAKFNSGRLSEQKDGTFDLDYEICDGVEMFVPEGEEWSWKQLGEYVKDYHKENNMGEKSYK